MSLIGNISRKASERNLPFIVIGGHAVMAHGFIRTTSDWDFLICKEQAGEWRAAMESLGFGLHFTGATFLQFQPPPGEPAALDLMLVDEKNFQQMLAAASPCNVEDVEIKVVSIHHLFVLKCHAFKNNPHRAMKDINAIVQLVRINKLDLNEPVLRSILLKYGGMELNTAGRNFMNYSSENAGNKAPGILDLEFPDWNGMKPHDVKMTPAEAFRWNEEMLKLFPPQDKSSCDPQSRCEVQFAL
jgi:hypothetical protein